MTKLQTKSGKTLFNATVEVSGVELFKQEKDIIAVLEGVKIGKVTGTTVTTYVADNLKEKTEKVKLTELIPNINPQDLIGKDPNTLSKEELIVLTQYLQDIAAGKVTQTKEKSVKKEEKTKPKLPKGINSYEDLAKLSQKDLWTKVVKPVVSELEGITSRSKKDEMLEAIAKYYGLSPIEEEESLLKEDKLPSSFDDEEDIDDEDDIEEEDIEEDDEDEEYEDDDEDIDDEDIEEDDEEEDEYEEDEDDEEEYEDDEDDEEDDEEDEEDDEEEYEDEDEDDEDEDEVTEEDVDALFESGNKKAIVEFCKKHQIQLPRKKLSAAKVKQIIKDQLFGEE